MHLSKKKSSFLHFKENQNWTKKNKSLLIIRNVTIDFANICQQNVIKECCRKMSIPFSLPESFEMIRQNQVACSHCNVHCSGHQVCHWILIKLMEVIKRNENISFQTLEESNSQTFCLFPCFRTGAAVLECSLDMTEFDHSIRFSDIRLWNSIARITDAHAHHCTSSGFQKFCPPCFLFSFLLVSF